ncbi:hypothetical protein [Streptomyces sp. NPDC048612]|uniref:hypothetical protein n=1 Tax=Streptomyces sp. NPDC048612 TaxID=3365579 RepID=UPI0037240002
MDDITQAQAPAALPDRRVRRVAGWLLALLVPTLIVVTLGTLSLPGPTRCLFYGGCHGGEAAPWTACFFLISAVAGIATLSWPKGSPRRWVCPLLVKVQVGALVIMAVSAFAMMGGFG